MKASLLAIAAFLTVTMISRNSIAQTPGLNPGDGLPAYETPLKSVEGRDIRLSDAAGKNGLLVMFSCNTCPFVIKNQPITRKAMEYAKAHNVGMVIINSNEAQRNDADSYEEMKKYAREQGYDVPYVVDKNSSLANIFGANHTPEVFLFNKGNTLVYKGAMNDNPSDPSGYKKMYIQDAIDAMIAGKEINPNSTKSIGCSIKRKA